MWDLKWGTSEKDMSQAWQQWTVLVFFFGEKLDFLERFFVKDEDMIYFLWASYHNLEDQSY